MVKRGWAVLYLGGGEGTRLFVRFVILELNGLASHRVGVLEKVCRGVNDEDGEILMQQKILFIGMRYITFSTTTQVESFPPIQSSIRMHPGSEFYIVARRPRRF